MRRWRDSATLPGTTFSSAGSPVDLPGSPSRSSNPRESMLRHGRAISACPATEICRGGCPGRFLGESDRCPRPRRVRLLHRACNRQSHPVVSGVGLKYYSPGCGAADTAVFSLSLGAQEQTTGLVSVDLASGKVTASTTAAGQVSSAVPTRAGHWRRGVRSRRGTRQRNGY